MREALSRQYDLGWREPNIQVWNVNLRGDRSLTLRHTRHNDRPLDNGAEEVVKHVARLWGFRVRLESVDSHDRVLQHWEVTPAPHPITELAGERPGLNSQHCGENSAAVDGLIAPLACVDAAYHAGERPGGIR